MKPPPSFLHPSIATTSGVELLPLHNSRKNGTNFYKLNFMSYRDQHCFASFHIWSSFTISYLIKFPATEHNAYLDYWRHFGTCQCLPTLAQPTTSPVHRYHPDLLYTNINIWQRLRVPGLCISLPAADQTHTYTTQRTIRLWLTLLGGKHVNTASNNLLTMPSIWTQDAA